VWSLPIVLGLAAVGGTVAGQTAPTASAPSSAPVQETKVVGTPPDVAGRWLAVGRLEVGVTGAASIPALWEITTQDGKPVMTHRFVTLPPALKAQLDSANAAGKAWEPTPDDLTLLAAQWDTLPADDTHVAKVMNELSGPDGLDDAIKNEPRSKDSLLLIRQRMDFDGKGTSVIRQVMVYSALAANDRGYTGNFDSATIAAAPFPVPIPFKGTFSLYRVGAPGGRGFLARVFDLLAGCGRRHDSS
jgi:hypothetical protein